MDENIAQILEQIKKLPLDKKVFLLKTLGLSYEKIGRRSDINLSDNSIKIIWDRVVENA